MAKKYYWLKLKRDFFKRHDIRIIEEMENGKDYILFYLKLLVESIDHEGELRFSDTIPYNDKMLATITNTNIDIVRSAMKLFSELQLVEFLDDETIYMQHITLMIGSEGESTERVRKYRKEKMLQCNNDVTDGNKKVTQSKSIDKDIELDIEKDFNEFWNVYPKKASKKEALKAYTKLYKSHSLPDDLLDIIKRWCNNEAWKKENGKFIPYPTTWLNQERWNDEIELSKPTYKPREAVPVVSFKED